MCFSFNDARNRQAFLADEAGYCARFGTRRSGCGSVDKVLMVPAVAALFWAVNSGQYDDLEDAGCTVIDTDEE
jgi:cbb3-type cytochrome oxidase maturation FixS-like protein/aromatic-ring opening dioxygenase LigAB LigA subunit